MEKDENAGEDNGRRDLPDDDDGSVSVRRSGIQHVVVIFIIACAVTCASMTRRSTVVTQRWGVYGVQAYGGGGFEKKNSH